MPKSRNHGQNLRGQGFLSQTRTVTPRDTKGVPRSSRSVSTTVRNTVIKSENKGHTSRVCKVLKERAKDKDNLKYGKIYFEKKFKELAYQKVNYENLNKIFTKKKIRKEYTAILDDTSDSNY